MIRVGRLSAILLLLAATVSGCATGPVQFLTDEPQCGPEPGSPEWWYQKAQLPPGARQKCYKGKNWPVQPRPKVPPQQFTHAYHSAHYWPLPYNCQDRAYVADIIHRQVRNGWQQQTTLYDRHFEQDQSLNVAGELWLQDLLNTTPNQYRTIYVQSTRDAQLDNARVTNVQQMISEYSPAGVETIPVLLSSAREYTRPASEIKTINELYNQSIPAPRLSSSGGGGGGSPGIAAPGGP